jgi:superfamily II DNA/RNA helicase
LLAPLERFKQGEIQILVASDVAARGLDIVDMSHVDEKTDIGHFVTSKIQTLAGVKDTFTLITFKAFS